MNICLKKIPEEYFPFNANINASLKLLIMLLTQTAKLNPYKNQIYIANLRTFSNKRCFYLKINFLKIFSIICVFQHIHISQLFILRILFQSHKIRHLGMQSEFKKYSVNT